MADTQLEILIKTISDTTGIKLTEEQVAKLKAGMAGTGEETKKLTEATEDLNHEHGKHNALVELLHHNHRALHGIMHGIGNEVAPHMGSVLGAALRGPLGVALAAVAAFELLNKHLEETNKRLEELEKVNLEKHVESIKEVQKAWDEAIKKRANYEAALATAGEENEALKQIDFIHKVTDARLEAEKKTLESYGKIQIARMQAEGASPEALAAAERANAAKLAGVDMRKNAEDSVGKLERELVSANMVDYGKIADSKQEELESVKKSVELQQSGLKASREALLPESDLMKRREKAAATTEDPNLRANIAGGSIGAKWVLEAAERELALVDNEVEQHKKLVAQYERRIPAAQTALDIAQRESDTANKNAEAAAKTVATHPELIKQARELMEIQQKGAEAATKGADLSSAWKLLEKESGGRVTGQSLGNLAVSGFGASEEIGRAVSSGSPLSRSQSAADVQGVAQLNVLLTAIGEQKKGLLEIVNLHQRGLISTDEEVRRLRTEAERIMARIEAGHR